MASQPLITATLLGLIWGDWATAITVGTVLQILAASTLPIGARSPEDYAVGGVAGTGAALLQSPRRRRSSMSVRRPRSWACSSV
jgi:mannose/fructose/N-acetylgalactosamine-specific phosphotransferase system component IIC